MYVSSTDSKQEAMTVHNMQRMMEKLKTTIKTDLKEVRRWDKLCKCTCSYWFRSKFNWFLLFTVQIVEASELFKQGECQVTIKHSKFQAPNWHSCLFPIEICSCYVVTCLWPTYTHICKLAFDRYEELLWERHCQPRPVVKYLLCLNKFCTPILLYTVHADYYWFSK